MEKPLSRLEARLQHLVEEGTARLFATKDVKSALINRLVESMQIALRFNGERELIAPHIYTIEVASQHASALKSSEGLMEEMRAALNAAAEEAKAKLNEEITFHVAPSDELEEGVFRVSASGAGEELEATQSLEVSQRVRVNQVPSGAFLIVNGANIFPLDQPIVNIGRKSDNHLVVDDGHVSRHHAQLRAIGGEYHFFDLGSTAGSTVNGQHVKDAVLLPGDVISLAGVPLIYGQDSATDANETREMRTKKKSDTNRITSDLKPES